MNRVISSEVLHHLAFSRVPNTFFSDFIPSKLNQLSYNSDNLSVYILSFVGDGTKNTGCFS